MKTHVIVKEISANKYLVGRNETSLIEGNIVFVIAKGEQTDEIAEEQERIDKLLINKTEGKKHYLIDLNECGKNSSGARKKWSQLADDEKIGKVAVFGLHPVAKVVASFVMKVSKKNNQRFFKTKEEALMWLKDS